MRRLAPADAAAYRALRLAALRDHPDAFTSSYEEEAAKPVAVAASRLAPAGPDAVWGAFAVSPTGRPEGELLPLGGTARSAKGAPVSTLAGIVGLGREARAKARHKATVFGMYVAPEHAGRGIGAALLQRAIDEARTMDGVAQLVLTVTATNRRALDLYERAGFRPFGTEPRATRVGGMYHDKVHMILFLTTP